MPEKTPGELKIKKNPDADHDHSDAGDLKLSNPLSVNHKRENGGKSRKRIENNQSRGYWQQPNCSDNGNKGDGPGTPPDDQQANVVPFVRIGVAPENCKEHNYTAEEPEETDVPNREFRT